MSAISTRVWWTTKNSPASTVQTGCPETDQASKKGHRSTPTFGVGSVNPLIRYQDLTTLLKIHKIPKCNWRLEIQTKLGKVVKVAKRTNAVLMPSSVPIAGVIDLASQHPLIAAEADGWDPTTVTFGSSKEKLWKCPKGHPLFPQTVNTKVRLGVGKGCPYCRGLKVVPEESLSALFPDIAAQWHPTKNGSLTPDQVPNRGDMRVWWQCPKVKEHVYEARVADRSDKKRARGCPFCSGNKVSPERSLSTLSPSVAKEWHPTKNAPLTPDDLTNSSNKKFWWQCKKDPAHEWEAQIYARTKAKGTGCPHCYRSKSKK